MRLILVRHGHPDYANDCLTPLGHLQAAAAAERLKDEGIREIFSSSNGRAAETAGYTARTLDMEITLLDFMREIPWHSRTGNPIEQNGHPWHLSDAQVALGEPLDDPMWRDNPHYAGSVVGDAVTRVQTDFDRWFTRFGFTREGRYYRCTPRADTHETVALFSHGGSSSAVLSHLMGLEFPYVCAAIRADFTAVTVLTIEWKENARTIPRVEILNDSRHILNISTI